MYASARFIKLNYTRETITDIYYFLERIEYHKPNSHIIFYMKIHKWGVYNDNSEKIEPDDDLLKLILKQVQEFKW